MKSDAECLRKKLTICDRNGIKFAALRKMYLPTNAHFVSLLGAGLRAGTEKQEEECKYQWQ